MSTTGWCAQLERWQDAECARVRHAGFVTTATSGRRRWLPGINSPDASERSGAERAACNTACQGAAADIVKWAMLRVEERLAAEGLAQDASMCLQARPCFCCMPACRAARLPGRLL